MVLAAVAGLVMFGAALTMVLKYGALLAPMMVTLLHFVQ